MSNKVTTQISARKEGRRMSEGGGGRGGREAGVVCQTAIATQEGF